ncbi:hypothetical protein MAR_020742 [Mya arenaria]|uniref:Uncharacterized protein n=1 Tax=Mya arenaria TaxID=6604 RepID=A0ABY7E5Q7_MYAAR|nr:hypothetical protein MAR_020742 [Mya arenaria]
MVNSSGQKLRPKNPVPTDKHFVLDTRFIKGDEFLVDDIQADDGERHIVLSTKAQLNHIFKEHRDDFGSLGKQNDFS